MLNKNEIEKMSNEDIIEKIQFLENNADSLQKTLEMNWGTKEEICLKNGIAFQYIEIMKIAMTRNIELDAYIELQIEKYVLKSGEWMISDEWKKWKKEK